MIVDLKKEDLTIEWIKTNIQTLISEHSAEKSRIANLVDYYEGSHSILDRVMSNEYVANNKLVNNFPKYITTVAVGYFMGNPISYQNTAPDKKDEVDKFKSILKKSDVESVDIDLATNCSIAGVGYELITVIPDDEDKVIPKSYSLDPQKTFVVYDNSVEENPLFGVYYTDTSSFYRRTIASKVIIATDTEMYELSYVDGAYAEAAPTKHYFGIVPIIEYKNNSFVHGDYEDVLTLIDAYNMLQSDRINDKEQLIDAILKLTGVNLNDNKVVDNIKENRIIVLPEGGDAEWLTKQLNEADTDVLRGNLESDIHNFSLTTNITDEQFSGNASGVAMQYKLFGFEQLIKTKERFFQEGLRRRITAYITLLSKKRIIKDMKVSDVDFVFNRNIPTNNIEIAQMISQLRSILSTQTLISQVPFVKDVDLEMGRIKAETKEKNDSIQTSFGFPKVGVNNEEDRETSSEVTNSTGE